jgi:hypothetical protein
MRVLIPLLVCPFLVSPQQPVEAHRQRFAHVFVVDASGGAQFTAIQPAITAAAPGDTVLVKSGTYAGINIAGKGLTIVGEAGSNVVCTLNALVSGVPADERVLLQNLTLLGGGSYAGLRILGNYGGVRVEQCTVLGGDGLNVRDSPNVLLRATHTQGADSGPQVFTPPAGHGGTSDTSNVAAYQSQFVGGAGGGGAVQVGGYGGSGWRQTAGELRVEASSFTGGHGGESTDCFYGLGGHGGDGLATGGTQVRSRASTYVGGAGGLHACGYVGADGSALLNSPGTFTLVPAPARTLSAPALVRDQAAAQFTFSGVAGETAFLLLAAQDTRMSSPAYEGLLFANPSNLLRIELGVLPGSGQVTYTWPIPDSLIPPGMSTTLTAQGVFQSSAGTVTLSNPVTLVVLDHSL